MNYEINISLNGSHFFATAERSITNTDDLKIIYKELAEHFTEEKGYEMSVSRYTKVGHSVPIEDYT